ncbi:MAG: DUF4870 domain-containing protein [Acidobacteriota bacterium]|nr:DUF4870 domain-containing protein [Acidobacteriota bacterium]
MSALPQVAPLPTQDEKSLAMITYILSIFAGWLAPLIIWLVKRESKFVSFHALQILFWHGIYLLLTIVGVIFFMVSVFATVTAGGRHAAGPPAAFFLMFPLFWGGWLINLVIGIVFAIKAKNGEWTRLPIVGNWARRAAGLAAD